MEKLVFRVLLFSISSFVISGCASTGVVPMGENIYMIGKKDGVPGIGVSYTVKAEVYEEANAYCQKKGLSVKTLNIVVTPAMPARVGSTELEFSCVESSKD